MRKRTRIPNEGELRTIKRFIWWPTSLRIRPKSNVWETRWLETAEIAQVWYDGHDGGEYWMNTHWHETDSPNDILRPDYNEYGTFEIVGTIKDDKLY